MKNTLKIFGSFFILVFVIGCSTKKDAFLSTKKDAFLNRKFHSISTKYNVLFNGKQAYLKGLKNLNENYEDNYWETLPIEPLKIDKLALPGMGGDLDNSPQEFEKAEEKAVKAIQKHSMLIARQERNSQIDDAYLLLGKARYYSKRFIPALEAFNYIIINYPKASLIDETKIWQSKANLRLQNENTAIETLNILLAKKTISKEIREKANTALAMAYVKSDSIDKVIYHLKQAVLTNNNSEQTARNLFVLGQIYSAKNEQDSSKIAFKKIIDLKKAPYKYKIHAKIELAKNTNTKEEKVVMKEELKKLIKNRYNRPYLDELYYRLGEITVADNKDMALNYYKKAAQKSLENNFQKELSYEAIGNLYFDKAKFSVAGAYYDSILQISTNKNSKRVRRLKRKRNNLEGVITYENIAKTNDSILKLVAMTKVEQTAFFKKHIKKLKAEDEKKQLAQKSRNNSGSSFYQSKNKSKKPEIGKWYFYNVQTVGFGQQEFINIWGNRKLEDNWRLSDKIQIGTNKLALETQTTPQIDDSKKYELSYYLENIPSSQEKIDTLILNRNNAYYKLGIIYQADFKEIDLAISRLEKLLTFNPNKKLEIPAKYHLYKMYGSINSKKSLVYKNDIITNYPDTKYAKIILNPTELSNEENVNTPEKVYAKVFYEYDDDNFESVIKKATKAIRKYEGEPIVAKFELLKAYAIGKKEGVKAFKEALNFVVANYPNTEEGKKAVEVLQTLNSKS